MRAIKSQPVVMTDPDTLILASNPLVMTQLSLALECEMLTNASAREAYARIYGREWVSLSEIE